MELKESLMSKLREEDKIDEATLPEPTQHVSPRRQRHTLVESDAYVAESRDCYVCSPHGANCREG